MRVIVLSLALVAGCFGCSVQRTRVVNRIKNTNPAEVLAAQTVVLRSGTGVCAGVYVRPALVATAAHCLKDINITITDVTTSSRIPAMPVLVNMAADLMIVAISRDTGRKGLRPAKRLTWGEHVFAMGHPNGRFYTLHRGYVSFPLRPSGETQLNMAIYPGFSGGPVVNRRGQLLGILTSTIVGGGVTDMVPVSAINKAMESLDGYPLNR